MRRPIHNSGAFPLTRVTALVMALMVALAGCSGAKTAERGETSPGDDARGKEKKSRRATVDATKLLQALEPTSGLLTGCIQSASKDEENPWGGLIVEFELTDDGDLARVEFLENDAGDAAARCVEEHLRKADLPATTGGPVTLRRFYAFSTDGEFDTEVTPPEETTSPPASGEAIVLEPIWMVPIAKEPPDTGAGSKRETREKRPRVELDSPVEITGPGELQRVGLEPILRLAGGDIQQCYSDALESRPDAQGEIVISFKLHEDGSMTDATASSENFESGTEKCVRDAIVSLELPPPEGGAVQITKRVDLLQE